jgi:hypothetical protein
MAEAAVIIEFWGLGPEEYLFIVHFFDCPKKQPAPSCVEGNQRKGTFSNGFLSRVLGIKP